MHPNISIERHSIRFYYTLPVVNAFSRTFSAGNVRSARGRDCLGAKKCYRERARRLLRGAMQPTRRVAHVARGALWCCAALKARTCSLFTLTRTLIGKNAMVCFHLWERARAASRNPAHTTRARDATHVQKEFWPDSAPVCTNCYTTHFPPPYAPQA